MRDFDDMFMRGAFALARRGLGRTWPNPAVGAVIVRPDGGEVVARGWTLPGGRPHAEREALERAGGGAKGATLYVTLEPCAHHGRTPPCADAILQAGISRVVACLRDPDPRVSGEGFSRLRAGGVEVTENVLEREGARLVQGHILRVTHNRPFVQLKLAVGSDGLVPRGRGAPVWATGEQARAHGHLLRARADAILVGRGTVLADDPALTCRLPGMKDRSPVRVALDSALSLSADAKLFADIRQYPLWVFGAKNANTGEAGRLEKAGAEVFSVSRAENGGLDPAAVLSELANRGITRLLIEGGPSVARSFRDAGLVDEICLYQGPEPAGSDGIKPFVKEGLDKLSSDGDFASGETRPLGRDRLTVYRRIQA